MLLEDKTRHKIPYPAKMCTYPLLEAQGRNSRPLPASLLNPPLLLESLLHPHLPPPLPGHNSFLGSGPLACLHQPSSHSPASQPSCSCKPSSGASSEARSHVSRAIALDGEEGPFCTCKVTAESHPPAHPTWVEGAGGGSSEVGQIPVLLLTSCVTLSE